MKVLLPVNLKSISQSTHNALKWLNAGQDVELEIIHVLDPAYFTMGDINGNIVMHSDTFNTEMESSKEELATLSNELSKQYTLKSVSADLLIGSIEDQVVERCQENDYDLIISETEGTHSFFKTLSGSLTGNLTRKIQAPVLALPRAHVLPENLESILIAHEFSDDAFDLMLVEQMQIFNELKSLVTNVVLIEIVKDTQQAELSIQAMKHFSETNKIGKADMYTPVHEDLEVGLDKCVNEFPNSLLCIGNHQHKGFDYFLEGCTAAELINRYDRPLLSFPLKELKTN